MPEMMIHLMLHAAASKRVIGDLWFSSRNNFDSIKKLSCRSFHSSTRPQTVGKGRPFTQFSPS